MDPRRRVLGRRDAPPGPLVGDDDPGRHGYRHVDPYLRDRLHARRSPLRALLRLHEPVRVLHADARPRPEPPRPLPGLGRRGTLLVPVDRFLVREDRERERGEEGVRHDEDRRHRHAHRSRPDRGEVRDARLHGHLRGGWEHADQERRHRDRACCCSPARSASPRRCRSTSGCRTPWPVRRPSPP